MGHYDFNRCLVSSEILDKKPKIPGLCHITQYSKFQILHFKSFAFREHVFQNREKYGNFLSKIERRYSLDVMINEEVGFEKRLTELTKMRFFCWDTETLNQRVELENSADRKEMHKVLLKNKEQ